MFIMDVPYVPVHVTPIVLAQSVTADAGATPPPDYLLQTCQESQSTGNQTLGFNTLSPSGMLFNYFQKQGRNIDSTAIKTFLLEGTSHGKLNASVTGRSYKYEPNPNYIGNDKAVFMAEFEGKVYKIVISLVVTLQINENPLTDEQTPVCPEPQLIKVNKPASGSSSSLLFVANIHIKAQPGVQAGLPQKRGSPSTLRWTSIS